MALGPGLFLKTLNEFRKEKWETPLEEAQRATGKAEADLVARPLLQPWKWELADRLQDEGGNFSCLAS